MWEPNGDEWMGSTSPQRRPWGQLLLGMFCFLLGIFMAIGMIGGILGVW